MDGKNIDVIEKDYGICITNHDCFLAFSDFTVSDGIDIVENVNVVKSGGDFNTTAKRAEAFNHSQGAYIAQAVSDVDYFVNSYGDLTIFTFMGCDISPQDFTDSLKVLNSPKGLADARVDLSHIIYIDKVLSPGDLIKIFKIIVNIKAKFIADLHLPVHIQNILNTSDFLAVLSNVNVEDGLFDINNSQYDEINFSELKTRIEDAVEISLEDAFEKLNLSSGILDYLVSQGILIGDLVEAGLDLADVNVDEKLSSRLEMSILDSLSDINVISLIIAALRLNQDLSKNAVREIGLSDDLNSFDVLGLAVANHIGGTEASFNFRKYIDSEPGIIYGLPVGLKEVFAGLIAGCVSETLKK